MKSRAADEDMEDKLWYEGKPPMSTFFSKTVRSEMTFPLPVLLIQMQLKKRSEKRMVFDSRHRERRRNRPWTAARPAVSRLSLMSQ